MKKTFLAIAVITTLVVWGCNCHGSTTTPEPTPTDTIGTPIDTTVHQ